MTESLAIPTLTDYQAKYFAHELQRSHASDQVGKLAGLLYDAQVEPKPHQIDAALFALQTPFLPGVIMADEVGLGKTIEAGIIISQYWAERKRRILIIAPSSLRQQWQQELAEKFLIPSSLIDSKNKSEILAANSAQVLICSYEFVVRHESSLLKSWDLVVCDEAHRLRNHWTGKNKAGAAVSRILENTHKALLLTATPLQNRLEELYGLVSVFDPGYFHSLDAFRERYTKNRADSPTANDDLAARVAEIAKRTLRKHADKYIHFTDRLPLTVEFTPSEDEIKLYDLVNAYLQRDFLYAFSASQRHLAALIVRKRLGSSTYASASTLTRIADRLEAEATAGARRNAKGSFIGDFIVDDDLETDLIEDATEQEDADPNLTKSEKEIQDAMMAEVAELRQYAALADSITVNQKAVKLLEALDLGYARLRELGAPEKAIIFTESTKTQEYLANTLKEAGHGDGLVLFNGSNDSSEQNRIYQNWLQENKGSDLITGIQTADRRKALVDYFRDHGKIMIATEAAAEGINLQFCSMLVNYDLPWNPQRVEQRIGRVHRIGQKHNVVVVNFANKGNLAEERILELLTDKFQLFNSVFGASDEILGSIEDGLDFEKMIGKILDQCVTAEQLNAAFDNISKQYASEISKEMAKAKSRVFDHLDPTVQDRLKAYDAEAGEMLNSFERLLLAVTQHELAGYADFDNGGTTFTLTQAPTKDAQPGRYFFKSNPTKSAHQYRYNSPLAQWVIERAKQTETPPAELVFSVKASSRVASPIKGLIGTSGVLRVDEVTFTMQARDQDISESYLLSAAVTDDGEVLDSEYVEAILNLTCIEISPAVEPVETPAMLKKVIDEQSAQYGTEVQQRNSRYYAEQEELIYRNSQDRKAEHEGRIREYRNKEREARSAAKNATDPMEQLRLKREARRWEQRADEADEEFRDLRKRLRKEADDFLDLVEQSLRGKQHTEHLFTIRWRITA